jgi:flagellar basal-body rod modification protein FlgD
MAVESIGTVTGSAAADTKQLGIGQEDFLKILLTQLTYQDPLKPMDNQEFIAQMAQFTSLEQTRQLNDGLESLLKIQSATQSVGLIGKTVEVRTASGSEVGEVTTVSFQNGSPTFVVKTQNNQFLTDVTLSQVFVVRQ